MFVELRLLADYLNQDSPFMYLNKNAIIFFIAASAFN